MKYKKNPKRVRILENPPKQLYPRNAIPLGTLVVVLVPLDKLGTGTLRVRPYLKVLQVSIYF